MLRSVPFTTTPAGTSQMSAVIVANFEVSAKTITVNFPHTGTWYHYYSGGDAINITNTATALMLEPGEARIYTNVALPAPGPELIRFVSPVAPVLLSLLETDNAINLQWQDLSSIETGFTIFRRPVGGTFAAVGTSMANSQFFTNFGGLEPLTDYEFYVEANTSYGASASNILTMTTSDKITGLEQEWMGVKVYPNPTNGLVTIETPSSLSDAKTVVRNMLGQQIGYRQVNENTIDLGPSPPGLYLVVVSEGCKSRTFKVLKR